MNNPSCGCVILLALTVIGVGCTAADWSYHFGISQGMGTNEFDRPVTNFDSEVTTVYTGLTYSPGVGSRHDEVIGAMERVEYATLYHQPLPHPVQDTSDDEAEDEHWPIAGPPKDEEEGRSLMYYGVYLVLAAGALLLVAHAWKMGLPIPFLPKYKGNVKTPTEE